MSHKVMVYPYDREFSPILRYRSLLKNMDIEKVVSPIGWGFDAEDSGRIDGGFPSGITVEGDFKAAIESCDTVLFSAHEKFLPFEKNILAKMRLAVESKKHIICTIPLSDEIREQLDMDCRMNDRRFIHYPEKRSDAYEKIMNESTLEAQDLLEIGSPVIFVMGIGEKTNKFEIQLALRKHFSDLGYQVSQIGSRNYCNLSNFHAFPEFMSESSLTESQKIVGFNRLVRNIEKEEQPDLFIIGIPGGIFPFDHFFTNRFGITAFEISQAIRPDAVVLSTYYENIEARTIEKLVTDVQNRLGITVDCLNIAGIHVDWMASKREKKMVHTTLDAHFVQIRKEVLEKEIGTPLYNIHLETDGKKMTDDLIDILEGYGQRKIA